MKKEDSILHFDQPDEVAYEQQKSENVMALERIQMVAQDKEINWVEEEETQVEQGQVVDVHMAPQVAKLAEERDKDTVVVAEKRE